MISILVFSLLVISATASKIDRVGKSVTINEMKPCTNIIPCTKPGTAELLGFRATDCDQSPFPIYNGKYIESELTMKPSKNCTKMQVSLTQKIGVTEIELLKDDIAGPGVTEYVTAPILYSWTAEKVKPDGQCTLIYKLDCVDPAYTENLSCGYLPAFAS